jgi:hypothetical protein
VNLDRVEKKLREARFLLDKMRDQEGRAFGDKEPVDFFLSAFLNAARTVDYRLRHEQGTIYRPWRATWDKNKLTPTEAALVTLMIDDRNVEVHESGSGRAVRTEDIEIFGDSYEDASGMVTVFGPPDMPRAVIRKPAYYFTIAGADERATEICEEYLKLLKRMVAEFKADHP